MRRLLPVLLLVASSIAVADVPFNGSNPPPSGAQWSVWSYSGVSSGVRDDCNQLAEQGHNVFYGFEDPFYKCWKTSDNPCGSDSVWDNDTASCSGPCDQEGQPGGSEWNSQTESCDCPSGTTDFFGTDGSYSCVPELPECTSSEPTFLGYVNDQPVCSYEGDCASGEQGGLVDGEWVCLPDACDGGTYINGACITPDDTTSQPQSEHNEPDTDGDGTPDSQDDDIDGDGVPNSEDDDIDGDGVLNADDQSNEDHGSATAQGGCDQPPSCTGDAQECALLKQQWYAMCYSDDYQSDAGGFYDSDSSDDIETRLSGAISDFKTRVSSAPAITGIDNFFSLDGGGSCPSYSVSAWVFDITLDQWCSSEIPWGMISGLLFAVALLIAARIAVS